MKLTQNNALARKLASVAWHAEVMAHESKRAETRAEAKAEVIAAIYGGSPWSYRVATREALLECGPMPAATSSTALPLWREAVTDAVLIGWGINDERAATMTTGEFVRGLIEGGSTNIK